MLACVKNRIDISAFLFWQAGRNWRKFCFKRRHPLVTSCRIRKFPNKLRVFRVLSGCKTQAGTVAKRWLRPSLSSLCPISFGRSVMTERVALPPTCNCPTRVVWSWGKIRSTSPCLPLSRQAQPRRALNQQAKKQKRTWLRTRSGCGWFCGPIRGCRWRSTPASVWQPAGLAEPPARVVDRHWSEVWNEMTCHLNLKAVTCHRTPNGRGGTGGGKTNSRIGGRKAEVGNGGER